MTTRWEPFYDETSALKRYVGFDGVGKMLVKTPRPTQELKDAKEFCQEKMRANQENSTSLWNKRGYVQVAHAPPWVIELWRKMGINALDKNDRKKIHKMLNEPEWAFLRTAPGRI